LFAGQNVDGTAVLIRSTRYGDSDLDLDVDLNDLGNLASNFGSAAGNVWGDGDFDDVDLSDLGTLATFFNTSGLPARTVSGRLR
jgi:hypothetical protein